MLGSVHNLWLGGGMEELIRESRKIFGPPPLKMPIKFWSPPLIRRPDFNTPP